MRSLTYINVLVTFVRSGDIETGIEMFNSMPNPSVNSWNAMLSAIPRMRTTRSSRDFQGNAVLRGET